MGELYDRQNLEEWLLRITRDGNWSEMDTNSEGRRRHKPIEEIIGRIFRTPYDEMWRRGVPIPGSSGMMANVIPGQYERTQCHSVLFVIIMPNAGVEKMLLLASHHLRDCPKTRAVVFFRMRWDIEAWDKYKKDFTKMENPLIDCYLCEPQSGPKGGFHKV